MPGHLPVCGACSAGLLRDLTDVPSLEYHLDLTLTRQTRIDNPEAGLTGEALDDDVEVALAIRRAPLPYDERARSAITMLRTCLTTWVRVLIVDEQRAGPVCRQCSNRSATACAHPSCARILRCDPPPNTLADTARWLLRQRAALLGHQAVSEAVDGIGAAIRQARRAIDRPPATWYAGPCNVDGCVADLYARHGERYITCRVCGGTHSAMLREQWLMKQVADQLGTATEIARALSAFHPGLTPSMIRGYAHRGRILDRGSDEVGRPLYRIGDVIDLLNERIAG
jgi:hypothetical protein